MNGFRGKSADSPPDRLAIGLVRDELRRIRARIDKPAPMFSRVYDRAAEISLPILGQNHRFSEPMRKSLKRNLDGLINAAAAPFAQRTIRQPLAGFEAARVEQSGFFYSDPIRHQLTRMGTAQESEETFEDDGVEFRFLRHAISGRQIVVDDFSCGVAVSFHALARMITRGACDREPVKFLESQAVPILTYATAILSLAVVFGDEEVTIPVKDGILVGVLVAAKGEQIDKRMRRRLLINSSGMGSVPSPVPNPFIDMSSPDKSMFSIRISTFMDIDGMSNYRIWRRNRLIELFEKHTHRHRELIAMISQPEILNYDRVREVLPFLHDYKTLIESSDWKNKRS